MTESEIKTGKPLFPLADHFKDEDGEISRKVVFVSGFLFGAFSAAWIFMITVMTV